VGLVMRWILVVSAALFFAGAGFAQVKMQGRFVAAQACPALVSIRKGSNPGEVRVRAGTGYDLIGKNKDEATHYWIKVEGATPVERWVAVSCGSIDGMTATAPKDSTPFYVLALSWQPAFCESKPEKKECRSQTASRRDAVEFSLHGLWPQPRRNVYCGVEPSIVALDDQRRWDMLPTPVLSAETRAALDAVMPGTQSLLERHEWIKHGKCYDDGNPEQYFVDAVRLTQAVNASVVQDFVEANIGKKIRTSDLRARFDAAFGQGAGERVRVACSRDGLISELTIGLAGDIVSGASLGELIAASTPTDAGCPGGVVDAVN
jgi:ribonuclease T2